MSVFKAYDIRGIVPQEIDADFALKLGRAFGKFLGSGGAVDGEGGEILVARDMRLSSEKLCAEAVLGLREVGWNVVDAGILSTPNFYFAEASYGFAGGVMVTASHNPPEYNGFKLVRENAKSVGAGCGMEEVQKIFDSAGANGSAPRGDVKKWNSALKEYIGYNLHEFGSAKKIAGRFGARKFKIVADAANAMGAQYMEAFFEALNSAAGAGQAQFKFVKMNFHLDGTFPAHQADPLRPENCADLCARVVEEGADLGIATDGDGDRIFFVDDKGHIVPQSIIRGLIAEEVLKKKPGAKICYDIRPGRVTRDMILAAGGVPVVTPVGHSIIKTWGLREGCVFAGELSGHFFIARDHGFYEDPVFVILTLLGRLAEFGGKFSALAEKYNVYAHSDEINFHAPNPEKIIEAVKKRYSGGKINLMDGVSVEFDDFWFIVRASNTEPLVRLIVEGVDKQIVESHVKEISEIIKEAA